MELLGEGDQQNTDTRTRMGAGKENAPTWQDPIKGVSFIALSSYSLLHQQVARGLALWVVSLSVLAPAVYPMEVSVKPYASVPAAPVMELAEFPQIASLVSCHPGSLLISFFCLRW
jgi:hypothetical protein